MHDKVCPKLSFVLPLEVRVNICVICPQRQIADMQAEPRRNGGKPVRALPGTSQLTIDEVPHLSKDGEKKANRVDTDSIRAITGAAPGSTEADAMDVEVSAFQENDCTYNHDLGQYPVSIG